jgi:dephospho-CoA kinase
MVIGISGRIGSGKDTVGKIIQYLTSDYYYPGYSFDRFLQTRHSFDQFLKKQNPEWNPPHSGWEVVRFGDKLKQIASLLTGIPIEKFEDQEFKKSYLGEEWNKLIPYIPQDDDRPITKEDATKTTVREFLQNLGTEAIRTSLHPDTWVNALFSDYESDYSKWIVTDVRFLNEVKRIKENGGVLIRVEREDSIKSEHISETELLDYNGWDYKISNNSSIEDLISQVENILISANLSA